MATSISTILVVEDESSIASFVSLYLRNAGYAVRTAANGTDAITQAATHSPALLCSPRTEPTLCLKRGRHSVNKRRWSSSTNVQPLT